jgi:hypothetical protein
MFKVNWRYYAINVKKTFQFKHFLYGPNYTSKTAKIIFAFLPYLPAF